MSEEGRYIKGGDGSHWVGCEETHWDCKIARLEKENTRLQKAVDEANFRTSVTRLHLLRKGLGSIVDEIEEHIKEYGKGDLK